MGGREARSSKQPKDTWTFMAYLAGDNNLTEEMAWGLQEIKKTSARLELEKLGINVVAHYDPRGAGGRQYNFGPQSGTSTFTTSSPDPQKDGNVDQYNTGVFSGAFVDASVAEHLAGRVFPSSGPGELANPARERLAQKLTTFLASEPLETALRRDAKDAAETLVKDFVETLGESEKTGLTGIDLVKGLQEPLEKASMNLVVTGDASKALMAFVGEQIRRPGDYFVVLSGHGSGAIGDFLTDMDPADSLSIPELARILQQARLQARKCDLYEPGEEASKTPRRIALFGMDSCLMSTAEVCYEIRDHARFLIGSEGFVSNTGWPYHRVLEAMVKNSGSNPAPETPPEVATQVAHNYSDFYRDYEISGISTDIAVCNLAAFRSEKPGSLVEQIGALCNACIPQLEGIYAWQLGSKAEGQGREKLVQDLSKRVAKDLTGDENDPLAQQLRDGTGAAENLLATPDCGKKGLTISQGMALWGLLDSIPGEYQGNGLTLKDRLEAAKLEEEVGQKPTSNAKAFAIVRAIRELDPGVNRALGLIKEKERQGDRGAMRARVSLHKLHQVRWILDLSSRVQQPSALELRLWDALVASRWEAQSFKAGVYVDLYDMCLCLQKRLTGSHPAAGVCKRLRSAIEADGDGAVVVSRHTGSDFQHAHGLSVYFPAGAMDFATEYENLEFAEATGWGRFLRAYLRLTRRPRRDEDTRWAQLEDHVLHCGELEVDPLETDSIEARIAGVAERDLEEVRVLPEKVRAGTERRIKAGTERRIKAGTERRIKAGTERRIKAGTERRIKGEGILALFGNPPDGFYPDRGNH